MQYPDDNEPLTESTAVPFLSVVIPTYRRPHFLPRAIDSALRSAPEGDVEVLVIPNGPDESWRLVAATYSEEPRVQWHSVITSHANVARNHGLALATGKYIRFLDDDDYLLEGAHNQCLSLDMTSHDVSQGAIELVDTQGSLQQVFLPHDARDFICSILHQRVFTLLHSFLWRRARVANYRWDPSIPAAQDVAWALGVAKDKDVSMHLHGQAVGAWIHHSRESTSQKASLLLHDQTKAEVLLDFAEGLERRSALSCERREIIGTCIWNCIHSSFPLAPSYWTRVAMRAMAISPCGRPDNEVLARFPFSRIHPLVMELILAPHRFLRHLMRKRSMP
jgi:hypothetical protein